MEQPNINRGQSQFDKILESLKLIGQMHPIPFWKATEVGGTASLNQKDRTYTHNRANRQDGNTIDVNAVASGHTTSGLNERNQAPHRREEYRDSKKRDNRNKENRFSSEKRAASTDRQLQARHAEKQPDGNKCSQRNESDVDTTNNEGLTRFEDRYPKRDLPRICYTDIEVSDMDEMSLYEENIYETNSEPFTEEEEMMWKKLCDNGPLNLSDYDRRRRERSRKRRKRVDYSWTTTRSRSRSRSASRAKSVPVRTSAASIDQIVAENRRLREEREKREMITPSGNSYAHQTALRQQEKKKSSRSRSSSTPRTKTDRYSGRPDGKQDRVKHQRSTSIPREKNRTSFTNTWQLPLHNEDLSQDSWSSSSDFEYINSRSRSRSVSRSKDNKQDGGSYRKKHGSKSNVKAETRSVRSRSQPRNEKRTKDGANNCGHSSVQKRKENCTYSSSKSRSKVEHVGHREREIRSISPRKNGGIHKDCTSKTSGSQTRSVGHRAREIRSVSPCKNVSVQNNATSKRSRTSEVHVRLERRTTPFRECRDRSEQR